MTKEERGSPGEDSPKTPTIKQDWHAFTARRLVAAEFRVPEPAMLSTSRSKADIAFARQIAMYLAHVVYQLSYQEVAEAFGRERSTVAHACALVEDARDCPELDEKLDKLEERMIGLDLLRQSHLGAVLPSRITRPQNELGSGVPRG